MVTSAKVGKINTTSKFENSKLGLPVGGMKFKSGVWGSVR